MLGEREDQGISHNKQFTKFLGGFKKLRINIPFTYPLEQMPSYAKCVKDILSNERKLEDSEIIPSIEKSSAIILQKCPLN